MAEPVVPQLTLDFVYVRERLAQMANQSQIDAKVAVARLTQWLYQSFLLTDECRQILRIRKPAAIRMSIRKGISYEEDHNMIFLQDTAAKVFQCLAKHRNYELGSEDVSQVFMFMTANEVKSMCADNDSFEERFFNRGLV